MPTLANALAGIPGYGGYVARRQMNEEQGVPELQRAAGLMSFVEQQKSRSNLAALQQEMSALPEDQRRNPEALTSIFTKYGLHEQAAKYAELGEARKARVQQAKDNLEARLYDIEVRSGDKNISEANRVYLANREEQTKKMIAQLMAGTKPEPAPSITQIVDPRDPTRMISINTRLTDEEKIRSGDTRGIVGVSGKEPAAQKKEEQKESGKRQLSDTVDSLASYYDNLEKMGAVVDPDKSTLSNVWERISASGVGQALAGAVGTEAQTERDKINMARAGLMAGMKQATGMSAQALNSNAELTFYMNMATDPTKSIKANRAALSYLDKAFGLGLGVGSDPSAEEELAKIAPKARYSGPDRRQPASSPQSAPIQVDW